MAIRLGEHYVWNGVEWDQYYMKTRADNVQEVSSGDGKYFLTTDERNRISIYLNTFNAANRLIRLDQSGKFSNSLMDVDSNINMNQNNITGIDSLVFTDDVSSIYTGATNFVIQTSKDLLKLTSADTVRLDAPEIELKGNTTVEGGISLTGLAGTRTINGVRKINFVDDTGNIGIEASQQGPDWRLFFRWGMGNSIRLLNDTAHFYGTRLMGVADPTEATDAVNRQWVEQFVAQGTHVVAAVRAASTTNITSLSGTGTTMDGVTLAAEDRVLVKNQTTTSQNGIYIVKSGAWTKLPNDSDKGSLAFVLEGTTNSGKQYYMNGSSWELFFSQDTYYAAEGRGLELDGTGFGFGIKDDSVTNAMLAGNISATKLRLHPGVLAASGGNLTIATSGVSNAMLAGSIDWSKLVNTATNDGLGAWDSLSAPVTAQPLSTKINQLFSAIKNLRGTANYNTGNTQTISGAYSVAEGKNKTLMGTAVPPAGYTGAVGDSYVRQLS